MVIYLSGPNGMYPIRDDTAYLGTPRSPHEASSDRADRRCAGIPERAGQQANRRAILFSVGVVLVAMLFILGWV
jgi:hypothetical protein